MNESDLRSLVDRVRSGQLSRRTFVNRLGAVGLGIPTAGVVLMHAGIASSQPAFDYKPKRRGGGGTLKMMASEGATLLNPHFASGFKDRFAARIFYEPLAQWDSEANLQPVLAAEIPSRENGGLAADGRSVRWKLKPDVRWHDGEPFTADDLLFNWQYAIDPEAATSTSAAYRNISIEKIDSHTVRVVFAKPSPFWPGQYSQVMLIPKHRFSPFVGSRSRYAPHNNRPVGTGAYTFADFVPGDLLRAKANPNYHLPKRPHFDALELKVGGDNASTARGVLQSGEYDYAGLLNVEDDVLRRMEQEAKGKVVFLRGSATMAIYLNHADPAAEIDGERSNPRSRHPVFSDVRVRRAIGLLIDRASIGKYVYGRQGEATVNYLNNPMRYRSRTTASEFDIGKANALLDAAGWKRGGTGLRAKSGKELSLLFQASTGTLTQKVQTIVKSAAQKAGVQIELKAIASSVYFSSDAGNPDMYAKFVADMQAYNVINESPDPESLMQAFVSWEVASKANKWSGLNVVRWQSEEFDALFRASESEMDPVRRAGLFIRMNDLLVSDGYIVPIVDRMTARALSHRLVAPLSGWQNDTAFLADWYRQS